MTKPSILDVVFVYIGKSYFQASSFYFLEVVSRLPDTTDQSRHTEFDLKTAQAACS